MAGSSVFTRATFTGGLNREALARIRDRWQGALVLKGVETVARRGAGPAARRRGHRRVQPRRPPARRVALAGRGAAADPRRGRRSDDGPGRQRRRIRRRRRAHAGQGRRRRACGARLHLRRRRASAAPAPSTPSISCARSSPASWASCAARGPRSWPAICRTPGERDVGKQPMRAARGGLRRR